LSQSLNVDNERGDTDNVQPKRTMSKTVQEVLAVRRFGQRINRTRSLNRSIILLDDEINVNKPDEVKPKILSSENGSPMKPVWLTVLIILGISIITIIVIITVRARGRRHRTQSNHRKPKIDDTNIEDKKPLKKDNEVLLETGELSTHSNSRSTTTSTSKKATNKQ